MPGKTRKADKKAGFGQGSGSTLADAAIAADPLRNLPQIVKIELRKLLGKKDGGLAEAIDKVKAKEMESGGEAVPSKFKGFSKLPEEVQKKMDPALAEKFEDGGPVKMGSGGGVCKGMGMARAGGKFKVR
tara:strand:+ start:1107 stop:1496 length:390 start_codon:yes stop_codon:yes gene_type:complete